MRVKIGLISDVHATAAPLEEALELFRREGVETILCAGDIAGYGRELESTVKLLIENRCRSILGNHDLWHLDSSPDESQGVAEKYLRSLPSALELTRAGRSLFMVHASPPASLLEGIRLRDESGELIPAQQELWSERLKGLAFDVLVVGHTHQVFAEYLGGVLVINPGSTRFNHSCAILQLPEMVLRILPLGGKSPLLAWNWGMAGLA